MVGGMDDGGYAKKVLDAKAAEAEFHKILNGAATYQQLVNNSMIRVAMTTDAVHRAGALDNAIRYLEREAGEMRRARSLLSTIDPRTVLPPPPPMPTLRPTTLVPPALKPKRL
jgi:hypothetical protein